MSRLQGHLNVQINSMLLDRLSREDQFENYDASYKLIWEASKVNLFRLIYIETNNPYRLQKKLEADLKSAFFDRVHHTVEAKDKTYEELQEVLERNPKGFYHVIDFYNIVQDERTSMGLNHRRDHLAEFPMILICYIPVGTVPECQNSMPDLWSFRSLVLEIRYIPDAKEMSLAKFELTPDMFYTKEERESFQGSIKNIESILSTLKEGVPSDTLIRYNGLKELVSYSDKLVLMDNAIQYQNQLLDIVRKFKAKELETEEKKLKYLEGKKAIWTSDTANGIEILKGLLPTEDSYIYLWLGIGEEPLQNYENALLYLDQAESLGNRESSLYFSRGYNYSNQGKLDLAIVEFSKAIEIKHDDHHAYSNRGKCLFLQGKYDLAIEDCTKSIEIKSDFYEAYYERGIAYERQGKYDLAIEDWTKAIEIKPDDHQAYYNRGIAYSDQGKLDLAINDWTKAIEIKPDYHEAYNNRGSVYYKQGKLNLAINDYTKAIKLKSDFYEAYNNRGNAYYNQGKLDLAINDYTKAIEIKPDKDEAYYNRGIVYQKLGEWKKANLDYAIAIKLNPEAYSGEIKKGLWKGGLILATLVGGIILAFVKFC